MSGAYTQDKMQADILLSVPGQRGRDTFEEACLE